MLRTIQSTKWLVIRSGLFSENQKLGYMHGGRFRRGTARIRADSGGLAPPVSADLTPKIFLADSAERPPGSSDKSAVTDYHCHQLPRCTPKY